MNAASAPVVDGASGVPVDPTLPVGTIVAATVDGLRKAVIRHAAGWVMLDDSCPHAQCPFTEDGEVADEATLICNCHGSEFDLRTGQVQLGPAAEPVHVTPLRADSSGLYPH